MGNVTCIGGCAFQNCYKLTTITIPSSVISEGGWVFNGCIAMTEINVDSDNPAFSSDNGIMYDKNKTTLLYCPGGKTQIEIPSTVTSIGSAAFWYNKMTSITIPNSVKSIGSNAFCYCDELTSINIPSSVESIGRSVFSECKKLTEISVDSNNPYFTVEDGVVFNKDKSILLFCLGTKTGEYIIPNTVKSIGDFAFDCCRKLTSIIIPNTVTSIGDYVFDACFALSSIIIPNSVTSIGNGAFRDSHITSITIPSSVTNIGYGAFEWVNNVVNLSSVTSEDNWGAKSYTSGSDFVFSEDGKTLIKYKGSSRDVYIPSTVTSIGDGAFQNHTEIASVYIPNSVESIGSGAFQYCDGLETVTIPESVKSIGNEAFIGCKNLKSIEIPNTVTTIGIWTFGNSGLQSFTIPPSVTSIGESAFYGCKDLTSIDISNSVKSIGSQAFAYSGLKSVYIANSVTYVAPMAFYGCNIKTLNYNTNAVNSQFAKSSSLETVNIGDLVTEIAYCAFQNCTCLTKVNIGKSVEKIGDYAFKGCSSLSSIDIPESVEYIGEGAFEGTKVNLQQENGNEDVLYEIRDGAAVVTGYKSTISGKVTIPSTVTIDGTQYEVVGIAANAFSGCQTIESVTIGDLVETIGECAFCNCHSIREVIIGKSVETIGNKAFRGCHKLRSVEVPSQVSSIGEDAFLYVKNVDYYGGADGAPWSALTLNGTKDGDFIYSDAQMTNLTAYIGDGGFVVIPKGVTSIGFMSFFESDNLESVSIPNTVTSIGGSAFANCYSLKTINVPLSVQMISRAAFRDCHSAVIYCEAPSQPYSWHKEWSYKANNILWGQTNPPVAINDELATGVVIYTEGRTIVVENATDEIRVYDVMGRIVGRDVARNVCTIAINKPGVYIVKTGATVQRVIVNY